RRSVRGQRRSRPGRRRRSGRGIDCRVAVEPVHRRGPGAIRHRRWRIARRGRSDGDTAAVRPARAGSWAYRARARSGRGGMVTGPERGSAIVEFHFLGILLLVPLVYIMLAVLDVQRTTYAVTQAAREAGRIYVATGDEAA